jgi:hypothetical protein
MPSTTSVFFDFELPNATTWSYFSFLLAVALFFKFRRFLSIRNWDVVSLYVLVPGFLLLQQANEAAGGDPAKANGSTWGVYVWLLGGCGYFFLRCLLDLVLVRRPALAPNLNAAGLTWLGAALFVCLISVAMRSPQAAPTETVGKKSIGQEEMERRVETAAAEVAGRDTNFWVRRCLAVLCHSAVITGLIFVGWKHFQDVHLGIAAATFYLLIPYTALHVGQLQIVGPAAFLVWAVVLYRRPLLTGTLLGLAAGLAYFPVVVFPVWFSFYRGRGAGKFATAFLIAGGIVLAFVAVLFLGGDIAALKTASALPDWQAWKQPKSHSIWQDVHWAYRLPVFVVYLAFVITTAFWPMPKNLAHLLALATANLIGIQFWYAEQGGVYVLWYLPLLLLLVFRPNLSERMSPPLISEPGRFGWAGRRILRPVLDWLRGPEPLARVH